MEISPVGTVLISKMIWLCGLQRVNLAKLGTESLWKYCKHYKLVCLPNSVLFLFGDCRV